jgi:hypothetical protein
MFVFIVWYLPDENPWLRPPETDGWGVRLLRRRRGDRIAKPAARGGGLHK